MDGVVHLSYRDYADHNRTKEMSLAATEFLRRFLLHVVPHGFMRIRHYGITANRERDHKLSRARQLLGQRPLCEPPPTREKPALEIIGASTTERSADPPTCPSCGGRLRVVEIIPAPPRESSPRLPAPRDTS